MRCGAAASTTGSRDLAGCCGSFELSAANVLASGRPRGNGHANDDRPCAARILAAAVSSAFSSAATGRAQQPVELKAGISDPVNTVLAWYMARDAGFYAAQGLKVEIVNMHGGSRGAAELQAGRLDVMHVGLSSVIRVNRAGGDIRLIGSLANVIRFTFFSAAGVRTAADLKGGVIGVSTFGSESDSTVTLALAAARADQERRDVEGIRRRLATAGRRAGGRDQGQRRSTSRPPAWRASKASTC